MKKLLFVLVALGAVLLYLTPDTAPQTAGYYFRGESIRLGASDSVEVTLYTPHGPTRWRTDVEGAQSLNLTFLYGVQHSFAKHLSHQTYVENPAVYKLRYIGPAMPNQPLAVQ